jgi:hypothetical protein
VYKNQQSRQTGSRNLMGLKTLPTIWGTYMKLVTNMILFFCCSIAWCSDIHTTKEQNHINHMGIKTPSYTTTKEQNHINHMSIRTPWYTTTKEKNHISHILQKDRSNLTEITPQSIYQFDHSLQYSMVF